MPTNNPDIPARPDIAAILNQVEFNDAIALYKWIEHIEAQVTAIQAERDGWKQTHDAILAKAREDGFRAELTDQYERWLLDIGRTVSGCEHLDERLPRCIEEEWTAMKQLLEEAGIETEKKEIL